MQKDNTTLSQETALRLALREQLPGPHIVLETHGGRGHVWFRCYRDVAQGAVIEKDSEKAAHLARQRPSWSVYQSDSEKAIAAGAGQHLPVNLVDVDPYGSSWPVLEALFSSARPWPAALGIAVNDGLRQKLQLGGAWSVGAMQPFVARYGNRFVYQEYLAVCRELLSALAAPRGYTLAWWRGYHCGKLQSMTHYAALFLRDA